MSSMVSSQMKSNGKQNTVISGSMSMEIPGRPEISTLKVDQLALKAVCPNHAIGVNPVRIDLGKCNFCQDCSNAFPEKIKFTSDRNIASNVRDRLIILEGDKS